jgi:hypothetical protein
MPHALYLDEESTAALLADDRVAESTRSIRQCPQSPVKKSQKVIGPLSLQQVDPSPLLHRLVPRVVAQSLRVVAVHSVQQVDRARHQEFVANGEKVLSPMLVDSSRMA